MILLDTNILTRMTSPAHTKCAMVRAAVHKLLKSADKPVLVPQNLYEFWAVATRPAGPPPTGQNGLGMTIEAASSWYQFFQRRFRMLRDPGELLAMWHSLVVEFRITSSRSHDARLVAAMQTHGVEQLLTLNADHFRLFPITIIDPASV